MNSKIFVQIASYCDPDLPNTLIDLIDNAHYPDNLNICIAWQYKPGEKNPREAVREYDENFNGKIKVIPIPYNETEGVCWARNLIQQHYDNEEYTLHLDSHHRFVNGWDYELIKMYQGIRKTGVDKPLITAYLPTFNPENDPEERFQGGPWCMMFDRFTPDGVIFMKNTVIPKDQRDFPKRTRFFSAHFAFTSGAFCNEVQHDPNYWFHGEEISIAARAYTHGYDLYAPNKTIGWHEYLRNYRGPKVWDDQPEKTYARNDESLRRNRILFGMEPGNIEFGKYGFGTARTLADYEEYAGICFADRSVKQSTIDNDEPPGNPDEPYRKIFQHYVDIGIDIIPKDCNVIVLAFEDYTGQEIYRKDITVDELKTLLEVSNANKYRHIAVYREFEYTGNKPAKIAIWPCSEKRGWLDKHIINI